MKFYDAEVTTTDIAFERVVTVFLTPFPVGDIRPFRCINCGKILMEYESEVGAIVDGGDKPSSQASHNILCHRCRVMFRFVS